MSAYRTSSSVSSQGISRRDFLTAGCLAASAVGVGDLAAPLSGGQTPGPEGGPDIDPGYIGPQFFDEREQQALREVLESGSPFRYWGPGTPNKVLRFEEAFAKYMGVRFALGVTSGTAALDCAVAGLGIGPGDDVIVGSRGMTDLADRQPLAHGKVVKVYPEIQNGNVLADVEVTDLGDFFVGERTRVWIPVAMRRVVSVPATAVATRAGIDYVTLAGGNVSVPVILGTRFDDNGTPSVEILSGLSDGDKVVTP